MNEGFWNWFLFWKFFSFGKLVVTWFFSIFDTAGHCLVISTFVKSISKTFIVKKKALYLLTFGQNIHLHFSLWKSLKAFIFQKEDSTDIMAWNFYKVILTKRRKITIIFKEWRLVVCWVENKIWQEDCNAIKYWFLTIFNYSYNNLPKLLSI